MSEHTHDHDHGPGLQHQFDDMDQQMDSVTLGMWAFLAQEIMFFGGAFVAYLVMRSQYPMAFAAGSNELDAFWGFVNTLVLIVSSLTMALAVFYAQKGNRNLQVVMIILTMVFGVGFLGVKAIEYSSKWDKGSIPVDGWNKHVSEADAKAKSTDDYKVKANPNGAFHIKEDKAKKLVDKAIKGNYLTPSEKVGYFNGSGDNRVFDMERFKDRVRIFYWIYFTMTGLHALHMVIGLGIMIWLLWKAWLGTFSAEYFSPVEISGLYWHFVDIVWIFLFPLLYLLGRHFIAGGH